MQVCKLSVCKEPTLYQSVRENVSESLILALFLHKTIQLSHFDLQSTARCPLFYKLVTSIAFSMNYSFHSHVCNIDTVMLQFWRDDKMVWHFVCHHVYTKSLTKNADLILTNVNQVDLIMKEFVLREVRAYVFCFGNLEERNQKFRHKAAPSPPQIFKILFKF